MTKISQKMNYISLFSGIGAFEKALANLGIPTNLIAYSEIDKYASRAYSLIHGVSETLNFGDITEFKEGSINLGRKGATLDLVTYGFPCQPFSNAGNQEGFADSKGRGNLFFDALRVIDYYQPKIAIAENVKNLTSKKFTNEFAQILQSLEEAGYNNYWEILNAKNYGVAQNRERVFIVSIRKDIDTGAFKFPTTTVLHTRLIDYLEPTTDTRYHLSERLVQQAYNSSFNNTNIPEDNHAKCIQVARSSPSDKNSQSARIYSPYGLCPTIPAGRGGNVLPKIKLLTDNGDVYRTLTPLECFRLLGFDDTDHQTLHSHGISNHQLYRMAGNSIVVGVLEQIFKGLAQMGLLPIDKGENTMLELTIKANSLGELHNQIASMAAELQNGTAPAVTKEVTQANKPTKTTSKAQETTAPADGWTGQDTAITDTLSPSTAQEEDLLPKLQEVARGLITNGKSPDVKAILDSVGATALSKIPVDKQAEVLASLELL